MNGKDESLPLGNPLVFEHSTPTGRHGSRPAACRISVHASRCEAERKGASLKFERLVHEA